METLLLDNQSLSIYGSTEMTSQDNLRDRIANLIEGLDDQQMIDDGFISSPNDIAQAIIDEFELTMETFAGGWSWSSGGDAVRYPASTRIVGKWEAEE